MATGRFAPSPSGPLHLGNLRTALVAWLFARASGGRFLLRIEDLDPVSSRPAHEAAHRHDLLALGIDWDGEVVRQSERFDRYREVLASLTAAGRTYPCYCTRREVAEAPRAAHGDLPEGAYPGTCRDRTERERAALEARGRRPSLRLRSDGVVAGFHDRVHGWVEGSVDDHVVQRNDGTPAYNLAVVVDDAAQGVDEVVRGDDLLGGTPRQVRLARLLGLAVPAYAHVPLVLGPDGARLAKRHGSVTLAERAMAGQGADEVRSMLAASLGLAEPGEPVAMATLARRFDPDRLPREAWVLPDAGAVVPDRS